MDLELIQSPSVFAYFVVLLIGNIISDFLQLMYTQYLIMIEIVFRNVLANLLGMKQ